MRAFWLSHALFLQEERCLRPSLVQLVKKGECGAGKEILKRKGHCHLSLVTGKKDSSGKLILKQVFDQRV